MKKLFRVQRLMQNVHTTIVRSQSVWTKDNIVNSPYNDVEIPNVTVPEYIWRNVDKWADKTAMVCGITNRSYTYHQLYKYSRNFAATLRKNFGIKDGDVVGLVMYNSIEYPIALIGAMQAGAIVTTMNPICTANEIHRQLAMAKPKIIISTLEIVKTVQEAIRMTKTNIHIIIKKNEDEDIPLNTASFEELITNNNVDKNILKDVVRKPDDVVLLPYSSGTTGLPKGVEITNRTKVANFAQREAEGCSHYRETTSKYQDSVMAVLPFYHVYGLSIIMLHNLVFGAKLVVLPKFHSTSFINALKNYKINLLYTAPPMALFLGSHPEVRKEHLVSVDRLITAAAPLPKSDVQRVLEKCQPNLDFIQIYGLTEVSPLATTTRPGSGDLTSVGFALPNIQLRVVGSNGRNLGPGEAGELHIRGPNVMKGYKDNPEATKATITDDGWLKSGDLVSINKEGAVTIVDRIKELIKVKGYQVPPAELEALLKEHPDVLDVAVIGIPDDRKGEAPKAFVVLKEGHKTTAKSIKEFVSKNVAEYKRIKEVQFLEALPKNSTGKILRKVLKDNNNNR